MKSKFILTLFSLPHEIQMKIKYQVSTHLSHQIGDVGGIITLEYDS